MRGNAQTCLTCHEAQATLPGVTALLTAPSQWGLVFKYLNYRSSFSPWSNCMSHAGRRWQHRSVFRLTSTAPCDSSDRAPFDFHRTPINPTGRAVGAAPGPRRGTAPLMYVRVSPADWTRSRGSPNRRATSITSADCLFPWAKATSASCPKWADIQLRPETEISSCQLCRSEEPAALGPGAARLCEEREPLVQRGYTPGTFAKQCL